MNFGEMSNANLHFDDFWKCLVDFHVKWKHVKCKQKYASAN